MTTGKAPQIIFVACVAALSATARTDSPLSLIPRPRHIVETGTFTSATNISYVVDGSLPAEGYRLSVTTSGVTVASRDEAGAFYARQTLKQLGAPLPCVTIEDSPAFKWRGFMLDEGRHFFGKEVVKRELDRMAEYKLNVFHWHLTEDQGWRLDIPRFPELVKYGAVRPESVAHGNKFGLLAAEAGHPTIVSDAASTYFSLAQGVPDDPFTYLSPGGRLTLEKAYSFNPYFGMTEKARPHVIGAECCMWSECTWNLYDLEFKLYPRFCAFAETVWTAPAAPRDYADFERRMEPHRTRLIAKGVNCAPLR